MSLFLTQAAPDHQYVFEPADVRLQARGARGAFRIDRLDAGAFLFRRGIIDGRSLRTAAEQALDADATFEPGQALTKLILDGLVTAMTLPARP